ncbi:MAG: hypothetical protein QG653_583 [Patescibacteria group bacterium]|nr:hypothetical protein [Patescibacteria group bacterium]
MWIFRLTLDLLFPSACYLCKKEGFSLCSSCVQNLSHSIQVLPHWIHTTYLYKDENVRSCLHQIKYYHRKDIVLPLVQASIDASLIDFVGTENNTVLVPIPMHFGRKWSRGYNHASSIANTYGKLLNIPVNENLLIRKKNSTQQATIKRVQERMKNVHNIFAVHQKNADQKTQNIILIDDTTTTHATLLEAKHVLEKTGYTNVKAITLAH